MASAGFSRHAAGLIYQDKLETFHRWGMQAREHEAKMIGAIVENRPRWILHHRKFAKIWARMAMESYSDAIGFASI